MKKKLAGKIIEKFLVSQQFLMKVVALSIIFFVLPLTSVLSQDTDKGNNPEFDDTTGVVNITSEDDWHIFGSDELLKLSLSSDLKKFRKSKSQPEYQDATLRIFLPGDSIIENKVRIKPRGIRRREYCYFPPLKLSFKGADFDNIYLDQQTSMKFVTHCQQGKIYEQYLLKEYLVYRMYNILTEYSFRVRLVQMEYIDTGNKKQVFTKYGFAIEPIKSLVKRTGGVYIKRENLSIRMMDTPLMVLFSMFQYMVGNTDWSITGLHNTRIVKSGDPLVQSPYPIPYDFDYTGFVNTNYAVPAENSGLEDVRQRLYVGVCPSDIIETKVINRFLEHKAEFYNLIEQLEYLDKRNKKETTNYLDGFYKILDSGKLNPDDIFGTCLQLP